MRDFAALHYVRSGRNTGAVWRAMALAPLPDSLAHTLDQFEARGRLPFYEEEIFDRHGWLAVLLGMGITPHTADPASTAIDGKIGQDGMARLAATLRDIAQRAPTYAA